MHSPQAAMHFNPTLLQEHLLVSQPSYLQLHAIIWSNCSGAIRSSVRTGWKLSSTFLLQCHTDKDRCTQSIYYKKLLSVCWCIASIIGGNISGFKRLTVVIRLHSDLHSEVPLSTFSNCHCKEIEKLLFHSQQLILIK